MRIACGLALAALAVLAAPAGAQEPRALLAFLPAESDEGLIERLHAFGAVGATSPTVGGYSPEQMYLDISQGSRVSTRVYDGEVPNIRLLPDGRIGGWQKALDRARGAPGEVLPGLLAETIERAGGSVAYAGVTGVGHQGAAAAADRSGRVETVSLGPAVGMERRIMRLLRDNELVVARLPAVGGLRVLDRLRTGALVLVVRAPVPGPLLQLPTAMGPTPTGEGLLTSRTTRRAGMVAAHDYAPTVLERLGLDVPADMNGHIIETVEGSPQDARSLVDRLAHVKDRRPPALRLTAGFWLVMLGGLAFAGRARQGLRLGLLALMWLPGVALVGGALDPSQTFESLLLAGGSLGLALVTDRLVPWPRAPAAPALVVFTAHAVDLISGSPLIVRSLAGPNPAFGARFYGIGNELEAILSVMVLIGAGAALAGQRGRLVPVAFGLTCLVAAVFMGAGRLGADVGGVITLGVGGAAAVLASLPGGPTRKAIVLAATAPVLALAALALLDVLSGGDAHLTRSVLEAESPAELRDVAERRFEVSWESLRSGRTPFTVAVFAGLLIHGLVNRRKVLAPLEGDRSFSAGVWGALAATVVGALANDSGPTIFVVGAAVLALTAAYLAGKPTRRLT